MKISVIVPVYNVEKYLRQCLDSLKRQSFSDVEYILVDDGSTDRSGEIADEYAREDGRFVVLHKKNGGSQSAVIAGLQHAQGEYSVFVDSDDFVADDYLQTLIDSCDIDTDMVCMNCTRYIEGETKPYRTNELPAGEYFPDENFYKKFICDNGSHKKLIGNARWGKLIKTALAKESIKYCTEEVTFGEDQQFTLGVLVLCKKIVVLDEYKYYYRDNPSSIVNSYKKNLWERSKLLVKAIAEIPEMKKIENKDKQLKDNLVIYLCECIRNEEFCGEGLKREYFHLLCKEAKDMGLFYDIPSKNYGRYNKAIVKCVDSGKYLRLKLVLRVFHTIEKFL